MRIALLTPEYPGCGPSYGIGRYVADLAQALVMGGATVQILATTDTGSFTITSGQPPVQTGPACPRLLLRPLFAARWLNAGLRHFAPNIIDLPNWGGLGAFLRTAAPLVVRLVTSAADPGLAMQDRWLPLRLAQERATVTRATRVVSDSAAMATIGKRLYHRNIDRVIHLAYRGEILPVTRREVPWVLFTGRLEHRKGIDVLLEAWPQVRAVWPGAHLHVVGPDRGNFAPRMAAMPGVTAHGFLPDGELAQLRAACRIQVIPSRFESFGLIALEAWAAGLGVVTTDAGSLPEIVGPAGRVARSGNPTDLARQIGQALDPPVAADLVQAGQRRLTECFSMELLAQRSLAVYRDAVRPDGTPT